MLRKVLPVVICALLIATMLPGCTAGGGQKQITLSIATAGDTNMEELQRNKFGPEFVKANPNVTINVVGTGPGDAGSQAVYTKLKAQKDAGTATWDLDVLIIHQSIMGQMINDGLALKYVPETSLAGSLTPAAKNALGTDVDGYVIPMFSSQVAIAYNPDKVPNPPKSYAELVDWIKANPNRFGYNGVKGGMSGVAFTGGYLYWKTGKYEQLTKGPYDQALEADWVNIFSEMKALPCTITNGNNGTLDMLNRGEIDMGPVWVDMFVLWKNEGRMDPKMRMLLPDPGIPGQPMYVVIPAKSAHIAEAKKYAEFICSPEQQAKVIVEQQGWYPGIDPTKVLPNVSEEGKAKLFGDIPPEVLNKNGLSFPLAKYMSDFQAAYEEAK
ncbi:MAG TPA: extracellular solute-binding protein [Anaerolineae bacterium]|nr:extracellular solute-binding protein [Anaerolineae bacterium]HPL30678.1 extracellular solute-binding protein [Anaerolineae bacterium]